MRPTKERPQFTDRFEEEEIKRTARWFIPFVDMKVAQGWVEEDKRNNRRIDRITGSDLQVCYKGSTVGHPANFSVHENNSDIYFRFTREGKLGIKRTILEGSPLVDGATREICSRMIPSSMLNDLRWTMVVPTILSDENRSRKLIEVNSHEQTVLDKMGINIKQIPLPNGN